MGVTQIVYSYPLHAGRGASSLHLVGEVVFGRLEHALLAADVWAAVQVLPDLLVEELGYLDGADGLWCFWVGYEVASVEPLVGRRYPHFHADEVEGLRNEGEELSDADPGPVEDLEHDEGSGLVHHRLGELKVLLLCPKVHLSSFPRAYLHGLDRRVGVQPVIPRCVIEDGVELVVDRPKVGGRVRLSVRTPVVHQLVLPLDDVYTADVFHPHLPEVGLDLGVYHVLLRRAQVVSRSLGRMSSSYSRRTSLPWIGRASPYSRVPILQLRFWWRSPF